MPPAVRPAACAIRAACGTRNGLSPDVAPAEAGDHVRLDGFKRLVMSFHLLGITGHRLMLKNAPVRILVALKRCFSGARARPQAAAHEVRPGEDCGRSLHPCSETAWNTLPGSGQGCFSPARLPHGECGVWGSAPRFNSPQGWRSFSRFLCCSSCRGLFWSLRSTGDPRRC